MRTFSATVVALVMLITSGVGMAGAQLDVPTTTEELLAGMVTEEVEPGVFRVVNDGVRDPTHPVQGYPCLLYTSDAADESSRV